MLTPFAGSGSECVAAKELGRSYIGFELEDDYIKIANNRLEHTEMISNEATIENPTKPEE